MSWKVKMNYAGEEEYLDNTFDSFEEAENAGCEELSAFRTGAEVLEMAGEDYMDPEEASFEIEEV